MNLFFYIFTYFFIFFLRRLAAIKHFFYTELTSFYLPQLFFRKNNHKCLEFCHHLAYLCYIFAEKYLNYD